MNKRKKLYQKWILLKMAFWECTVGMFAAVFVIPTIAVLFNIAAAWFLLIIPLCAIIAISFYCLRENHVVEKLKEVEFDLNYLRR